MVPVFRIFSTDYIVFKWLTNAGSSKGWFETATSSTTYVQQKTVTVRACTQPNGALEAISRTLVITPTHRDRRLKRQRNE